MADLPVRIDVSRSFFGMDSFSDPQSLDPNEYVGAMNVVSRGGIIQTRPGSRVMACAPSHENLQGLHFFQPTGGRGHLVLAVDGAVYVSAAPFTSFTQLPDISFSPFAKYVSFAVCLQSTDYDNDGALFALAAPRSVLVMQDGQSRAAYWDGSTARHLNPNLSVPTTLWITGIRLASNGSVIDNWSAPVQYATGTFVSPVAGVGETVRLAYIRSDTTPTVPIDTQGTGWSLDIPEEGTKQGFDETKIGLWMAWSNNRLWVSRDGQVFASDIGNPLKFTETQYIAEGRAFYLDDDCTGIVELTDQSGILVFTKDNGTVIRSSITDRTQWLSTPDFQQIVLQKIGCVAPRSIVVQYGLIWWFSAKGMTALDAALRHNLTSKLNLMDQEIIASKHNCSPDLSMICGAFYENYLLMSVPSGDVWNKHTWCLDQDPFPGVGVNANSWNSWWSGWRPVQWTRGIVDGNERLFFLSRDFDFKGRVWEAMLPDRMDNGCPITCAVEMREHNFGDMELKRFKYAEAYLKEAYGSVSLMMAYKSTKGPWTRVLTKQIEATAGQIYEDGVYSDDGNRFSGNRPQSRTIRTSETAVNDVPCQADCGVESDDIPAYVDHAFSLLMVWSGRMGVYGYRIFSITESSNYVNGRCEADEVAPRSVETDGSAALSFFTSCNPFPLFTGSGTFSANNEECGGTVAFSAESLSIISQTDADNKATCAALTKAQCYADGQCGIPTFCNVEQTVTVAVDCGNGIRVCDGVIPVSIACSSLSGDGQFCGWSAYSGENNGPYYKWSNRTLSGFIQNVGDYGGCDVDIDYTWSGSASFSGCAGPSSANEHERNYDIAILPCTIVGESDNPATEISGFHVDRGAGVFTQTTAAFVGNGSGGFGNVGSASESLGSPDTAYTALIRGGTATPGSLCQTSLGSIYSTSAESQSPINFYDAVAVSDVFTIGTVDIPLTPGEVYTATITLTKTPSAGGDEVTETVNIEFVADSAIDTIDYEVPVYAGYYTRVTNVEVLAGNVPCDGPVSASFTIPANAYCASAQVTADRLAYAYAIEQATAAAQSQLSCIYGNTAQSYTATCPGVLGDGVVIPAGAAIGNPVTVTIAAGTYTASTQDSANALALAEAQTQAEAGLVCFWTNTPQSAEYCCQGFAFSTGAGLASADGIYLYNSGDNTYVNSDTPTITMQYIGGRWVIKSGGLTIYQQVSTGGEYPWSFAWEAPGFFPPAPTVYGNPEGPCGSATIPFNSYNSDISQSDADTLAYAQALLDAEASVDCNSDVSDSTGTVIIV